MGVVFEALHTRIKQRVAIKMLLPEVIELPDVVSRFEREARAAGQLRSENTTRVLDVDISEGGLPYMVMEFLDGQDLGRVLETQGAQPIPDSVDYVLQACNAMAEAHAAGIIHRDLKPSNLFVCGADHKVKVLDFGISKLENDAEARVTATQAVVGTPLYMSPEQVRSAKHVDSRSDIWSLGIILYELLAGRTPFEGSTTAAAAAICIDDPPPLSGFRQIPAELEAAILKALQKDPKNRFPNVQSLAIAIAPFGSGRVRAPGAPVAPVSNPSVAPATSSGAYASLGEDRTLASSEPALPHSNTVKSNATMPGWTTRSGAGRSKNLKWLAIGGVGVLVLGVGAVALGSRLMSSTPTRIPTSDTQHAATPATATAPATTPMPSASVSQEPAVPSTSVISRPAPSATAAHPRHPATATPPATAPTATPSPTHAAPAPTRL